MRKVVPVVFLLSGGNWNNTDKAGVDYRNSNNVATNTNRNIGSHVELRTACPEQSPEQHFNLHPQRGVKHTASIR